MVKCSHVPTFFLAVPQFEDSDYLLGGQFITDSMYPTWKGLVRTSAAHVIPRKWCVCLHRN